MMNDRGKSDRSVVPEKPSNKADNHAAEMVEGRDWAKGNSPKRDKLWTPSQVCLRSVLERVGSGASLGAPPPLTRGKSRIWEICTSGSVRGVESDLHPYRDNAEC